MQRETDHHVIDDGLALVPVKTLRFASTTPKRRGFGLDRILDRALEAGAYVMVRAPLARNLPQTTHSSARMDDITDSEIDPQRASLARCRELLGDEAAELSDEQLDAIRQHAQAMANVLVELFLTADSRS